MLAAGEHVHGTMAVTLAAVPRRGRLLAAKLAATGALAASGALVSSVLALLVVRAVSPAGSHRWGNPLALLGVVATVVAVAAVGTAAGLVAQSSTASVAVLAAAVLLPQAAAGLLGSLQPWVVGASPSTVVTQVVGGGQLSPDQAFPWGTLAAVLAMLLVAALVAATAGVVLARRDG